MRRYTCLLRFGERTSSLPSDTHSRLRTPLIHTQPFTCSPLPRTTTRYRMQHGKTTLNAKKSQDARLKSPSRQSYAGRAMVQPPTQTAKSKTESEQLWQAAERKAAATKSRRKRGSPTDGRMSSKAKVEAHVARALGAVRKRTKPSTGFR